MKILIPTAKQLSKTPRNETNTPLTNKTLQIAETITTYNIDEISKLYKIKPEQAKTVKTQFQNLTKQPQHTTQAIKLFNGLMYRNINIKSFTDKDWEYLNQTTLITSSLYGIITPQSPISDHRLDFLQPLKIQNQTLKQYWREEYDKALENENTIISLLSNEFEEVFSPNMRNKFTKILFLEYKNGEYKTHSTTSKKGRGQFLTALVKNKIKTIDEIKKMNIDGYTYLPEKSTEKELVFLVTQTK